MTSSDGQKHAMPKLRRQIERTMRGVKTHATSDVSVESEPAAVEWAELMFRARQSAKDIWESYLTEDPASFDATVARLKPGSMEIRALLGIAYHEPSPSAPSKLGAASASRYEPIKAAIRKDWMAALAQGTKKSKRQFVKDWIHKQTWDPTSLQMTAKALYGCLPKTKSKK